VAKCFYSEGVAARRAGGALVGAGSDLVQGRVRVQVRGRGRFGQREG
jgi:hypothetical protein